MSELLIGCGNDRSKRIQSDKISPEWTGLITLDIDARCEPDVLHDLNSLPYPFKTNQFDEIHAYEVLEHCGRQGDYKFFFDQFYEFWRILKPGGYFIATVPMWDSMWTWGDPGHTRVITKGSLIFLDQNEYSQLGKTCMTDYRSVWHGDFEAIAVDDTSREDMLAFMLRARK